MTFRSVWIVAIALPLAVGCQQPRAERDMQRELRFQEDRIYQLEDWIRQYNEQLGCCRNENVSLRSSKPAGSSSTPKPPVRVSPFGDAEPKAPEVPDVEIPKVEIPKIETPPAELPAPLPKGASNRGTRRTTTTASRPVRRAAADRRTAAEEGRRTTSRPADSSAQTTAAGSDVALASFEAAESADPQVRLSAYEAAHPKQTKLARITLNRMLTAPLNRDGQPGDDGIMTVVEPRNEAGELIPPGGDLSVSVIDPAATSEQEARVGRWDFDALQTTRLYRRTTLGDGIQLNLFWQERKPVHKKLDLYVRLTTPDGRKLETRRRIEVKLPAAITPHEASHPEQLQPEPITAEDANTTPTPAAAVEKASPVSKTAVEPKPISKPEPAAEKPSKEWTAKQPSEKRSSSAVTKPVQNDNLFQVVPVAESPSPSGAPRVLPAVEASPVPLVASRPSPAVVATPAATTVQPAPRVPRRIRPASPPAEEQVAIPREPGNAGELVGEPAEGPAPAQARPQWTPYRK